MSPETHRVLVIGAHPDDCDLKAGGVANKYCANGTDVKFVSMTNGASGHHTQGGATLVQRRAQEAQNAADVAGLDYEILDNPDGALEPSLSNRRAVIELIRNYNPDLVLTHRPNDYHPDHRYTSRLVQDAAYMVTVPNVCPNTQALVQDPVIAYLSDEFQRPYEFSPDAVVAVDDVMSEKFEMLDSHTSQFYEWLPYNAGILETVPDDPESRQAWLQRGELPIIADLRRVADRFRDQLVDRYGEERGQQIQYAEAFEACEYGRPLDEVGVEVLFPFELAETSNTVTHEP